MATPHAALGSAINSALSGGTVSVYDTLAVQGGTPPYAIFQAQNPGEMEYTFSSSGLRADYVLKVISNRTWPGEAQQVYSHLHELLQNAALVVSGYSVQRCRVTSGVKYRDEDGFWHIGGVYRIDLQES